MKLEFEKYLNEAPLGSPASLPPAAGGGGAPPPSPPGGGMGGGMPPMPPGGGMGGGMPPMPPGGGIGGGMPGAPNAGNQKAPKELKQMDVWGVLEELLGAKKNDNSTSTKHNKKLDYSNNKHLMS